MRKILFFIFIAVMITGCSKGANKDTTDSADGIKQNIETTQQSSVVTLNSQPSAITQVSQIKEPVQNEYPKVLKAESAKQINYYIKSDGVYCIYGDNKYGFMKENGDEITSYIYDYAYPFSEGLACVRQGEKYGFIDAKGTMVIPFTYDLASPFSEGLAYFETGEKYGFIDKNGNVAFLLDCDSVSSFKEGLAYFSDGGKYGYIDKSGKVLISPKFDDVSYFQNGIAKVRVGLKLGVIDKNGTEILPADYDDISFDKEFIIVQSGGKYGCFDKSGKMIYKPVYDSITMLPGKNSAIVYLGERPQIINYKGEVELSDKYDSIAFYDSEYGDAMIEVCLKGKYGFLKKSDLTVAVPTEYDGVSVFKNGYVVVKKGEKYGIIDKEGKQLVPLDYDYMWMSDNGTHTVVAKGDKYGVIDKEGKIVLPLNYDYIEMFDTGTLALNQGGKYVLAESTGKPINKKLYDSIEKIGSCYKVELSGKYGILNENGIEVVTPKYDYMSTINGSVYGQKNNNLTATVYGSESENYIIETKQDEDMDLSRLILQNQITPRIKPFNQVLKSGSINIPSSDDVKMAVSVADGMKDCYREYKLYDIDGSGTPVLYFYAEGLIPSGPRNLSYSGLYSVKNGRLNELTTGYECGGTAGGDVVSFFKDTKTSSIFFGKDQYAGGFQGSMSGREVYKYEKGEGKKVVSYECIVQTTKNHSKRELLKNAELFYDENGNPYDKDTILQADYATEYWRDGKRITAQEYKKYENRYEKILYIVR